MFDELFERIRRVDEVESNLLSLLEGKTWEQIALALYQSLDDIDTVDDMCKENIEAFRNMVMKLQAKKNQLLYSPDGYGLKRVDEDTKLYTRPHSGGEKFRINHPDDVQRYKELTGEFGDYNSETHMMVARWSPVLKQFEKPHPLTKETVKTWEVNECVCHIYGLDDDELLKFYRKMSSSYRKADGSRYRTFIPDKKEVETEIKKRGLEIPMMMGMPVESKLDIGNICPYCKKIVDGNICPTCGRATVLVSNPEKVIRDEEHLKALKVKYFGGKFRESKLKEGTVDHATRELKLAGMFDKEVDGSSAAGSMNILISNAVIELMEVFAKQGHSGMSASMVRELFVKLSNFESLTELTDTPDEWNDISEMQAGELGWQSQRNPSCFSEDGGKTYWNINEEYYFYTDENGDRWSGGLSKEEWNNRPMHTSKRVEKKE